MSEGEEISLGPEFPDPGRSGRRRRWVVPLTVSAVLVGAVAAVVITAVVVHGDHASNADHHRAQASTTSGGTSGPTAPATTAPTTTAPTTPGPTTTPTVVADPTQPIFNGLDTTRVSRDPHFATTLAYVDGLLTNSALPPGSQLVSSAPEPDLAAVGGFPTDGNLITRGHWYTAPGSLDSTLAFVGSHAPAGMGPSQSSTGTDQGIVEAGVTFTAAGNSTYDVPELQFEVTAHGSGVAFQVVAGAIWIPTRPAADTLGPVSAVDVTVARAGLATVHRTLQGGDAARLVAAVNALSPTTPGVSSCPGGPSAQVTLTFHLAAEMASAVGSSGGCSSWELTVPGHRLSLNSSPQLSAALEQTLKLPADYGL